MFEIALCNMQDAAFELGNLATDLCAVQGEVPEWVELIPAGRRVVGRDGREWVMSSPDAVVTQTNAYLAGLDAVVDWEHASDRAAPEGKPAPAGGWIKEFEVRNGAIWGRVEWVEEARNQIADKKYRYISPVFSFDRQTHEIIRIDRAGLTNKPNLTLTALNSVGGDKSSHKTQETFMDKARLCALLGLPATATDADIEAALHKGVTALNSATNNLDLSLYVPKAQHDAVLTELNTIKTDNANAAKSAFDAKVTAALDKAVADGKLVPAARDHYQAMCTTEDGLTSFEKAMAAAPKIVNTEGDKPTQGTETAANSALSQEERNVAKMLGHEPAAFLKVRNEKS